MVYPWAGFGSFQFNADERPSSVDDSGWTVAATSAKGRALGSLSDSITLMALGSKTRDISVYMTADRLASLQALVGTTGTFCDWGRPTPDSRSAYLDSVTQENEVLRVSNFRGFTTTDQRRKVRLSLTSQ